jgi:hypothetical protein
LSDTALFSESQRFISRGLSLGLLVIALGVAVYALTMGELRPARVAGVTAGVLGVGLFYFLELSVTVYVDRIGIRFTPLFRKSIALSDVRRCVTRSYRPLLDYGGWGIRRGRRGWAYTVSGKWGVDLVLADGRSLLIGSQRAEELSAAIRQHAPALET